MPKQKLYEVTISCNSCYETNIKVIATSAEEAKNKALLWNGQETDEIFDESYHKLLEDPEIVCVNDVLELEQKLVN